MAAELLKRIQPELFYQHFAQQGLRPDGRLSDEGRAVSVNVGPITTANGSSLVRIGQTTVVCGIKAEIASPDPRYPGDGFILPNIEIGPLCHGQSRPGLPSEREQTLSEHLQLHTKQVLDAETLCIMKEKAVWVLYIDCVCLAADGNVVDAAHLAMSTALLNTRLPTVEYVEVEESVRRLSKNETQPLQLSRTLCPATFALMESDGSSSIILDPDDLEESIAKSTLHFLLDAKTGNTVSFDKPGGTRMSLTDVQSCFLLAEKRRRYLCEAFKDQLHPRIHSYK